VPSQGGLSPAQNKLSECLSPPDVSYLSGPTRSPDQRLAAGSHDERVFADVRAPNRFFGAAFLTSPP
jgi:hypothetical protein